MAWPLSQRERVRVRESLVKNRTSHPPQPTHQRPDKPLALITRVDRDSRWSCSTNFRSPSETRSGTAMRATNNQIAFSPWRCGRPRPALATSGRLRAGRDFDVHTAIQRGHGNVWCRARLPTARDRPRKPSCGLRTSKSGCWPTHAQYKSPAAPPPAPARHDRPTAIRCPSVTPGRNFDLIRCVLTLPPTSERS